EKSHVLTRSQQRHTVAACFLSWTLDALDFFIMVFVLADIAKEFDTGMTAVTIAITLTLAARPLGALLFGYMADRVGRRRVLILNVLIFTAFECVAGLGASLAPFIVIRALCSASPWRRVGRRSLAHDGIDSGQMAGHGLRA